MVTKSLRRVLLGLVLSASIAFANPSVELVVLGVAQDAGYPQAGCYKPHCLPGWQDPNKRLGATSLAVIDHKNKQKWLFEATPHMPEQLYALEQLASDKDYLLSGVFLTHAHIGHYTGLMFYGHEAMGATDIPVYAMPRMLDYLTTNGPWSQLVKYNNIALKPLVNETAVKFARLSVTPVLVPHRDEFSETVGYIIKGVTKSALFIPDINKWQLWEKNLVAEVAKVDYALIDATFYADGEIPGRNMADIPHPFVVESMQILDKAPSNEKAKVHFIHMNHTNPMLDPESQASKAVINAGFNIARPGMLLEL